MAFSLDLYTNIAKLPVPPAEDNGSITLAIDTGIQAGNNVMLGVETVLGDGPYGTTSGDFDFYRVSLTAGQQVTARVDAAGISGLDTSLTLFDAAGNAIAYNDDFDGDDPFLKFTAVTAGDYFIRVMRDVGVQTDPFDSSSGTGTGALSKPIAYRLWINTGAPLPFPTMGDDTLNGDFGNNLLFGAGGNDNIFGGGGVGSNVFHGGSGINYLYGEAGDDLFVWTLGPNGGGGNSVISADLGYDRAEFNGQMTIDGPADDLAVLWTAGYAFHAVVDMRTYGTLDSWWGHALDDVEEFIFRLHGGDDQLVVQPFASTTMKRIVFDGGTGNDKLSGSQSLVPILAFGGAGADKLVGGKAKDVLDGGSGNDTLKGGKGADTMRGGTGNDVYVVDNKSDKVVEKAGGGADLVKSSVTYKLGAHVENLTLTGTGKINGTGNAQKNVLTGNAGANTLDGGKGNDVIKGGGGKDRLVGGEGNDTFVFAKIADSKPGSLADVIADFDKAGNDRIDLSALYGAKLTYIHDAAFTAKGQVRIKDVEGPDLIVQVNTGGSLAADFEIRLANTTLESMAAGDFIL